MPHNSQATQLDRCLLPTGYTYTRNQQESTSRQLVVLVLVISLLLLWLLWLLLWLLWLLLTDLLVYVILFLQEMYPLAWIITFFIMTGISESLITPPVSSVDLKAG